MQCHVQQSCEVAMACDGRMERRRMNFFKFTQGFAASFMLVGTELKAPGEADAEGPLLMLLFGHSASSQGS